MSAVKSKFNSLARIFDDSGGGVAAPIRPPPHGAQSQPFFMKLM
ncbi:hypothetical protein [Achromobacter piechaudii]|uniref:Uncharacterized protein n=1 Tax=Achromobacter piechaudii ATCC 43553 TaxID=742159 RepID=D4XHS1_9BURK|nr:hypothetical protein [Achromobacter piechaudii]EFF73573.1 hypothetical protein HMPREF0004_5018 [Achromobacter piechaudii ATCC 43553]